RDRHADVGAVIERREIGARAANQRRLIALLDPQRSELEELLGSDGGERGGDGDGDERVSRGGFVAPSPMVIVTVGFGLLGPLGLLLFLESKMAARMPPATTAPVPVQNHQVVKIEPSFSASTTMRSGTSASPRVATGSPSLSSACT